MLSMLATIWKIILIRSQLLLESFIRCLCIITFESYIVICNSLCRRNFSVCQKTLKEPFSVSTSVGDPLISRHVYKSFPFIVSPKISLVDLVELEIVDFDIIVDMDFLHSFDARVGCRTRIVRLHFPNEALLAWKDS